MTTSVAVRRRIVGSSVAFAILGASLVVLLVVAFFLGRATAAPASHVPATRPTSIVPAGTVALAPREQCLVGQAC